MLGLLAPSLRPQHPAGQIAPRPYGAAARFLLPLSQCEFQLTSTIEQLQKDPWPVANDRRPSRCTGAALSVAVGLMETSFPNSGARIILYAGGPCTEGPGMVVGTELKEPIRSHHDIERDNAKYYRKASKVNPPGEQFPPIGSHVRYSDLVSIMKHWRKGPPRMVMLSTFFLGHWTK